MPFRRHKSGVTVSLKVTPSARRTALTGLADGVDGGRVLKASLTVAAEDGKANKALIALLSKTWGVPKSAFSLLSGNASRQKVVLVEGDSDILYSRLSDWSTRVDCA